MGRVDKVLFLGAFNKKVGKVVGANWRGIDVIRSLPRKSSKPPTELQQNQRDKFKLVTSFLSWIGVLIDIGYKSLSKIKTPMNVAVNYHLKEAITGIAPNFTIDFAKVRFSVGRLELPGNAEVASVTGGDVKFDWTHTLPNDRYIDATDLLTVMVYNPLKDKFVSVRSIVARSAMTYTLALPADFVGDSVHCYISFNSVLTKNLVSNSLYLGSIPVTI